MEQMKRDPVLSWCLFVVLCLVLIVFLRNNLPSLSVHRSEYLLEERQAQEETMQRENRRVHANSWGKSVG